MGLRRWVFGPSRAAERTALLVDGPNVLRPEFGVDLAALRRGDAGGESPAIARMYLDEHASPGLIRAAEANGFEVTVTSGDVDVRLAIDAVELVHAGEIEVLAIASRDADFKPVFERAAVRGIRTRAIAPDRHGRAAALVNAADDAVLLDTAEETE